MTEETLVRSQIHLDPTVVLISLLGFVLGNRNTKTTTTTTMDAEAFETAAKTPGAKPPPRWREKLEDASPQMLFAVTRRNDDARVSNIAQMSASILSNSRVLFFQHVSTLLRILDKRVSEQCYQDTYENPL